IPDPNSVTLATSHSSRSISHSQPVFSRRQRSGEAPLSSLLTPHIASLTLSQSSHAGSEAAKPLSGSVLTPHSSLHTQPHTHSRQISFSVLTPATKPLSPQSSLSASHLPR
ncbi:hypothetical protein Ancab_002298, partial [Ancistrocladus abbreviatus]